MHTGQERGFSSAASFRTSYHSALQAIELAFALPTSIAIGRAYGLQRLPRYLAGFGTASLALRALLSAMMGKDGQSMASLADVLTLSRAGMASVLAGLATSGIRDRQGCAGWLGWTMFALGATDWLDGPLARRIGPTRLGGALDIESDSWLILWSAASAVAGKDLPGWSLLPPLLHFLDPFLSLRQGDLPQGGGPWWSRVIGACQAALLLVALAPLGGRPRRLLALATGPVIAGQCAAVLVLLARKLQGRR